MPEPDPASAPYRLEWREGVADIQLTLGKANALNGRSLAAIAGALREAGRGEARGVVLRGYDRFFSAGLDLVTLYDLDRAEMDAFVREFDRVVLDVFAFPRPVVAALSGHAVAGGLILALACDARVAVEDGIRLGLNEIRLGLPFPAAALEVARHAVPGPSLATVLYEGELYGPREAHGRGLVTALTPDDAAGEALALCRRFAAGPPEAFAAIKTALKGPGVERAASAGDALRAAFVDAWYSPEGRHRIGEARARLVR